jgi:hypothetical protein
MPTSDASPSPAPPIAAATTIRGSTSARTLAHRLDDGEAQRVEREHRGDGDQHPVHDPRRERRRLGLGGRSHHAAHGFVEAGRAQDGAGQARDQRGHRPSQQGDRDRQQQVDGALLGAFGHVLQPLGQNVPPGGLEDHHGMHALAPWECSTREW